MKEYEVSNFTIFFCMIRYLTSTIHCVTSSSRNQYVISKIRYIIIWGIEPDEAFFIWSFTLDNQVSNQTSDAAYRTDVISTFLYKIILGIEYSDEFFAEFDTSQARFAT